MGIPENLYACAICENSFPIAKSLVDHVNNIHVKSLPSKIEHKREMETKIEPKKEAKIEQHNNCVTEVGTTERKNNQQFQCNYCDKSFNLKCNKIEHERIHTGQYLTLSALKYPREPLKEFTHVDST